jgi:hypothetical protein
VDAGHCLRDLIEKTSSFIAHEFRIGDSRHQPGGAMILGNLYCARAAGAESTACIRPFILHAASEPGRAVSVLDGPDGRTDRNKTGPACYRRERRYQVGQVPDLPSADVFESVDDSFPAATSWVSPYAR